MRMGDTIMFRGKPRFLVLRHRPGGFLLEGVRGGNVVYYTLGPAERELIGVTEPGDGRTRARARKLLESTCLSHTHIEWDGDVPTYVHTVGGVAHRMPKG